MRRFMTFLLLPVFFIACKDNSPVPLPAPSRDVPQNEGTAHGAEATPEKSPIKAGISARAEVQPVQEGFQKTFDLSIGIAENNLAAGSATVGPDALTLTGALIDDTLRLWAVGADSTALKGGFFIGEMKNGKVSGTFALSGSGGVPNLRGTWKTL